MSQSSASTATPERAGKRTASDEFGNDAKKMMTHHQSRESQLTDAVPKLSDPPRFVSATTVKKCTPAGLDAVPEMTDEEILAYTIEFEKRHPQ